MSVLCQFLGHARSTDLIRRDGETYRSRCRRCRLPLIRVRQGLWKVTEEMPNLAFIEVGGELQR